MMTLHWDKLSPAEFQQLQDFAAYSTRKLEDVLAEFCGAGTTSSIIPKYHPDGDIDYEGFRKFLDTYLDVKTPDELSRHLFLSFIKKGTRGIDGKAFKKKLSLQEMAALSSTAACAPITSHTTSSSNVNSTGLPGVSTESHSGGGSSLADKIHGLTEKIQALGHHRTDSEASARARTGSVHPMLTVAHTSYSCHDVLEKKSTDSSPSHSQMSRNSSRKSNNSLLVNNGKLEGDDVFSLVYCQFNPTTTALIKVVAMTLLLNAIYCLFSMLYQIITHVEIQCRKSPESRMESRTKSRMESG